MTGYAFVRTEHGDEWHVVKSGLGWRAARPLCRRDIFDGSGGYWAEMLMVLLEEEAADVCAYCDRALALQQQHDREIEKRER